MKPGDIVLIRFPQADLKTGKLRPALVITIAPGTHADLILALITSRTYQAVPNFDEIIAMSLAKNLKFKFAAQRAAQQQNVGELLPSVFKKRLYHRCNLYLEDSFAGP